jgi:hypothetical protein
MIWRRIGRSGVEESWLKGNVVKITQNSGEDHSFQQSNIYEIQSTIISQRECILMSSMNYPADPMASKVRERKREKEVSREEDRAIVRRSGQAMCMSTSRAFRNTNSWSR